METNSVAEMYNNANLKDGQTIINATTTISEKYIAGPVYMERKAITTGFVIEFNKPKSK